MKIGVIGIGKLGLCTAEVLKKYGHDVIGMDINKKIVKKINSGICPTDETDLKEYMEKYPIRATTDIRELIHSDISFIITPTPSLPDGSFDDKYVKEAVFSLLDYLPRERYHLFNIVSTVMPGTCREIEREISKYRTRKSFGIAYNPEFIAQGSILKDFQNPDFVLMGGNIRALDILTKVYSFIPQEKLKRMSLENAEIAKLALNSFVTMKINYGNLIANMCENIKNGDCDIVSDAIGTDSRIGNKCLKGGTSYGGPCFPRDNVALFKFCEDNGIEASILRSTDVMNENHNLRLYMKVRDMIPMGGTVAILGLPYKPNTSILTESAGVKLQERLRNDYKIQIDNVKGADLAVVMLPQTHLNISKMRKKVVIDCWRTLENEIKKQGGKYHAIGKG